MARLGAQDASKKIQEATAKAAQKRLDAEEAAKAERMPFHFFIPVAAVYLALTAVTELFIKWLDKRANVGVVQGG